MTRCHWLELWSVIMKTAIVRVRQNRCDQWNIDSSLKRGLAPFVGKALVPFEVIQGQAVMPVRQMALWAAIARRSNDDVAIFDATREYLTLWQYERVVFFMDACNASETLRHAKACLESGIEVAIASGAKDVYRANAKADYANDIAWIGLSLDDAHHFFAQKSIESTSPNAPESTSPNAIKTTSQNVTESTSQKAIKTTSQNAPESTSQSAPECLIPDWCATPIGDYCPYFVPISLAYEAAGNLHARSPESIIDEIRQLKKLGVLTESKKVVFDSPFTSQAQAHEAILRLALRLITEDIAWAAYLPALTDGRDIARLRRAGLCMAFLGSSMNFHGLMHDGIARNITAESIEAFKSRGIIVGATLTLTPSNAPTETSPFKANDVKRLMSAGIDLPEIVIDTPYPETAAFASLCATHSITSLDWNDYDGSHLVYTTPNAAATANAIEADCKAARRDIASPIALATRLFKPTIALVQHFFKSALPLHESIALRFALAASAYKKAQSTGATPLPSLDGVTLIGKYA